MRVRPDNLVLCGSYLGDRVTKVRSNVVIGSP
jgi:hypothetical protein